MPTELSLLLPSHSLEDFPTHLTGRKAEEVLAAWSALWHPALLAAATKIPTFLFSGDSLTKSERPLVVIPSAARDQVTDGEIALAREQGTLLVEGCQTRDEFAAAALKAAQIELASIESVQLNTAADFFALAFAYLQTELLTRRMRYSSHLDEDKFERAAIAAAEAWKANDQTKTTEQLSTAFNCLMEARCQFYPVDAYLIDVLLIAPTTIGPALRMELASKTPTSVMISAGTLEQMAEQEPESLALLRQVIEAEKVGLIGSDIAELELPLMPHEVIFAELQAAKKIYEQLLGRRPTVFGRRRFGLTPVLPQILNQAGFNGAWHIALDDGQFPKSDRRKSRWEGMDDSAIDTLTATPLDASRPESYLQLAEELGNTMDHDFVATLIFARWPGQAISFHSDLQRTASYAPLLGKFVTIDTYFRDTEQPGNHTKFSPDQYRPAYLQQAVTKNAVDPISTHVRNAAKWAQQHAAAATATMAASIDAKAIENLEGELNALPQASAARIATALPTTNGTANRPSDSVLVVNPLSFQRQIGFELPQAGGQIRAVTADVPAMGFAWLDPAAQQASVGTKRRNSAIAEGNVLRNRHYELTIHPATGGIQSIYDLRTHGNRLSQQLAVRLADNARPATADNDGTLYTEMKADAVNVLHSDSVLGRIASRGVLLDAAGKVVSRFTQTFSLWQGSRVIELEIGLSDFTAELGANPWASYLAARFAWSDPAADLHRSVHGCRFTTESKRIIATDFIEIATGSLSTAIFPVGLPYHQRSGPRMLDTLLRVRGETASTFRLGIGLDVPHSWRSAQELLVEPTVVAMPQEPLAKQGWLFHFDAPHVTATSWSPLVETGRVMGFRVRLLETEGHGGRVAIRSFKPPVSAMHTNVDGEPQSGLPIDGDAILLDIGAYQWTQVEARW